MKLFSSKKRAGTVAAVAALTLIGGGVAYGYWTSGGTGTGSASTAAGDTAVTFTQTGTLNPMYPGDAAQNLNVTVTNPLAAVNKAYIAGVTAYVTTTGGVDCDGSNYLINGSEADDPVSLIWAPAEISAGGTASTAPTANTIRFNNKSDANQNLCKSAVVTIHYAVS